MIRRYLRLASPLALACLLSCPAMHASPVRGFVPAHAMFGKTKTVKVELRNTTQTPIALHAGDQNITVEPGKTMTVSLPAGTRITTVGGTSKHPAGTLIIQVYDGLNGAIIDLN